MDYINSKTLEVLTLRQVVALTGASIPPGHSHGDWFPVMPSDPTAAKDGEIVEALAPIKKSGVWFMGWSVRPMTDDEIAAKLQSEREAFKAARSASVASIVVTTEAGNSFDGDEDSQGRMTRAVIGLQAIGGTIPWVLADNTAVEVDAEELLEALTLAGAEQSRLWVAE